MTIAARMRKIRALNQRIGNSYGRKTVELEAEKARQYKMLPKFLWVSMPPHETSSIKAYGTYSFKKDGPLKAS